MTPRLPSGLSHPVALGTGGFGTVLRARQDALNRLVALKFIPEKKASIRKVLMQEASMQAQLHLKGVPEVYDVKEVGGNVCIVMQWIRGCSLREIIGKELPPDYILAIITEIVALTASLHEMNFVHRDIKPENIIISPEGVFFIDFGFSLGIHADHRLSVSTGIKGTPLYLAPELRTGQGGYDTDYKRADLYSMGKVVAELIDINILPTCIAGCLSESPDRRPVSATEVLQALRREGAGTPAAWQDSLKVLINDTLSIQLYSAVQELLHRKRSEEAYTLLLECININPEFPGALELIGRFPVITKNQALLARYRYAVFASMAVISVLLFFIVSMKSDKAGKGYTVRHQDTNRTLFISSAYNHTSEIDRTLPFKDTVDPQKRLIGNLHIFTHPDEGSLIIDGEPVTTIPETIELSALHTRHSIIWKDTKGSIIWKEVITTHPFEIKRICIKER